MVLPLLPGPHVRQFLLFYALVAFGTAASIVMFPWVRNLDAATADRVTPFEAMIVGSGTAIIVVFCFLTGNHQFGGYDLSPVIDLGWRQYLDQKPYRDFICTMPIGFVLAVGIAFRIGGPFWDSIVLGAAALGVISWIWNYALVRRLTGSRAVATLLSATLVSCSVLVYGHLFHSMMAAVVGQILVLSAMCLAQSPRSVAIAISLATSVGAMLLMKPNTAAPLVLGLAAALLWRSPEKQRVLVIFLAGAAAAGAVLFGSHFNALDVLRSYLGVSGRANPDKLFIGLDDWGRAGLACQMFLVLTPGIFAGPHATDDAPGARSYTGICWATFLVGLYSMATNWDLKLADLTFWILAVSAYPLLTKSRRIPARAAATWSLFALMGIGIASGVCRTRNRRVGYETFFEWKTVTQPIRLPFFRHLTAGPILHRVVAEASEAATLGKGGAVFFGPRMEFLYAALRIESPRGLPLWWHPGSSYPLDREQEIVSRWSASRFQTLVFLHRDYTRVPAGILRLVARDYLLVKEFPDLSVFLRKPRSESDREARGQCSKRVGIPVLGPISQQSS